MDINQATEIMEAYVNSKVESGDAVRFVLPVSGSDIGELFLGFVDLLTQMARVSGIPYEVIADPAGQDYVVFQELTDWNSCIEVHQVGGADEVLTRMEAILTAAPRSALLVSWEGHESELAVVLERFARAGIEIQDLSSLIPLRGVGQPAWRVGRSLDWLSESDESTHHIAHIIKSQIHDEMARFWDVRQNDIEAQGAILVRAANMLKWLDRSEVMNGRKIPSAKFLAAIDDLAFCQWRLMLNIAYQAGWGDLVCDIGYLDCPNVFCWKPTGGPIYPWEVDDPEERMFPLGTAGTSVEFPLHAVFTSGTTEMRRLGREDEDDVS
jgi:hypothetical protein